jgi:transcriptional regulator with XRE-family HTH domain
MTIAASRTDYGRAGPVAVRPELARLLAGGPFPEALRAAIKGSGLSLDRIQHRLQLRGVTISVATLSYWQSGRRRPERPESLDALRHLEAVLRVPPNALTALLGPPRPRGRRRHTGRLLPIDVLWGSNVNLVGLLSRVNTSCDGILARISQHDRCDVDARRRLRAVAVSQVLRAEQDGADRWILVYDWEVTTKDAPRITGLRNCRLGRIAVDHDAHILVAELLFDRPLATGETLIMEYQVINPVSNHGQQADSYFRRLRLPVRDYVVEVQFDQDALPTRCQQFSSPAGDVRMARRRNLTVNPTGEVHAVALGVGPGLFGIEWDWPTAGPTVVPSQPGIPHQAVPGTQSANASVHS